MVTRHFPVEGEFFRFFNYSKNAMFAMFAVFAVFAVVFMGIECLRRWMWGCYKDQEFYRLTLLYANPWVWAKHL